MINNKNNGPGPNQGQSSSPASPSPSISSSTAPPVATAQTQATAINTLLLNSEQSRSQWNSNVLVNNVGNCVSIPSDVSQIQDIANQRASELSDAKALQTDQISNGITLKSQLMTALQISLKIDRDYLAWARQQQSSGCGFGFNSSYYQEASNLDPQASNDKQVFVDTWNPIANQYGLTVFQNSQI